MRSEGFDPHGPLKLLCPRWRAAASCGPFASHPSFPPSFSFPPERRNPRQPQRVSGPDPYVDLSRWHSGSERGQPLSRVEPARPLLPAKDGLLVPDSTGELTLATNLVHSPPPPRQETPWNTPPATSVAFSASSASPTRRRSSMRSTSTSRTTLNSSVRFESGPVLARRSPPARSRR